MKTNDKPLADSLRDILFHSHRAISLYSRSRSALHAGFPIACKRFRGLFDGPPEGDRVVLLELLNQYRERVEELPSNSENREEAEGLIATLSEAEKIAGHVQEAKEELKSITSKEWERIAGSERLEVRKQIARLKRGLAHIERALSQGSFEPFRESETIEPLAFLQDQSEGIGLIPLGDEESQNLMKDLDKVEPFAEKVSGMRSLTPETASLEQPSCFLGLSVDRDKRIVRRKDKEPVLDFSKQNVIWDLFCALYDSREKGMTSDELCVKLSVSKNSTLSSQINRLKNHHIFRIELSVTSSRTGRYRFFDKGH